MHPVTGAGEAPRDGPSPGGPLPGGLPSELASALRAFERHLDAERGLSPHTVRAYVGDAGSLLGHAAAAGASSPAQLTIAVLRG
jgi:integrase/recombinase XerC